MAADSYSPKAGLQLSHTVVLRVLARIEFWLLLVLHLSVFGAHYQGYLSTANQELSPLFVRWDDVKTITMFTAFFLIFHTGQCYARYWKVYSLTRRMIGAAYDFSLLARLYMRPSGRPYDRIATRLVAMTVMFFFCQAKGEARGQYKIMPGEWSKLIEMGLVTKEEYDFLQGFGGQQRSLVALHAAGDLARQGLTEAGTPGPMANEVIQRLLRFRGLQQEAQDFLAVPAPFGYFHLVSFMVFFILLIWAYGLGVTRSAFAPLCYVLVALLFMGMRELAAELAAPFGLGPGSEEEDNVASRWAVEFLQTTASLLDYEHDGARDSWRPELAAESRARTKLALTRQEVEALLDSRLGAGSLAAGGFGTATARAPARETAPARPLRAAGGYTELSWDFSASPQADVEDPYKRLLLAGEDTSTRIHRS